MREGNTNEGRSPPSVFFAVSPPPLSLSLLFKERELKDRNGRRQHAAKESMRRGKVRKRRRFSSRRHARLDAEPKFNEGETWMRTPHAIVCTKIFIFKVHKLRTAHKHHCGSVRTALHKHGSWSSLRGRGPKYGTPALLSPKRCGPLLRSSIGSCRSARAIHIMA